MRAHAEGGHLSLVWNSFREELKLKQISEEMVGNKKRGFVVKGQNSE